jgi:hypothetical protein
MQERRGRFSKYGSAWLSYVRKGCCCTARPASVDAASSQSNQRGFRIYGVGRQAVGRSIRSLWPDLLVSTAESLPAMLCAVIVSSLRTFRIPHPLSYFARVAKLRLRSDPTKKDALSGRPFGIRIFPRCDSLPSHASRDNAGDNPQPSKRFGWDKPGLQGGSYRSPTRSVRRPSHGLRRIAYLNE